VEGNLRGSSAQTAHRDWLLEKDEDTKEEVPADGSETTMEWREGRIKSLNDVMGPGGEVRRVD